MDMNVYYSPGNFGLRPVKDHDVADSYEFDMIVVWARDSDGTYWVGQDSGCSCPSPFESHTVEDLGQVRTLADVAAYARSCGWDENGVAALMDGLRLDGMPAVVEGSVVGSEPALQGRPELWTP